MHSDYFANNTSTVNISQPGITDLWEAAFSLGYPAALWRLPNQVDKHLIVSFDEVLPRVAADLDELPAGFLISPFDHIADRPDGNSPAQTLFLRANIQTVYYPDGQADVRETQGETADRFWRTVATLAGRPTKPSMALSGGRIQEDPDAQEQYIQNVTAAVEAMQQGMFRKVVLSRRKQVEFTDAPNAVALFDKLCQAYPTAFISAVSIPEKGQIWISATPERLVSTDANGIFQTASLAGTQSAFYPDGTAKRPPEAMWSQKEIEEQAMVSRYIIECFKKIRLREYVEEGPKTLIAGNLMHLSTYFTVDTQAVRYPQLGTVMLRLLHPTSAVCGTPRDKAFAFIQQHETHDRELYSGFLGPVNVNTAGGSATSIFVHIRCMKLEGSKATLYAGAGLTEDSVPEHEWQETEMKCQTLLNVMMNDE